MNQTDVYNCGWFSTSTQAHAAYLVLLKHLAGHYNQANDPAHDWLHICRVLRLCTELGQIEGGDIRVLSLSALFHDVVNLPKNHPQRKQASALSADFARKKLWPETIEKGGFLLKTHELDQVCTVIEQHSFSRGLAPDCLEAAILQDADRLDAMGAIGIMRAFSCGATFGASYYDSQHPFAGAAPLDQSNSLVRLLDDKKYTVDHFYTKLLKLEHLMNTPAARLEAKKRKKVMLLFLESLACEIDPNDKSITSVAVPHSGDVISSS